MAGSDELKKTIPSWQQQHDSNDRQQQNESTPGLVEQAAKFLQDESISGQSIERKTEFLKSKGLSDGSINSLLGSPTTTTTTTTSDQKMPETTTSSKSSPPRDVPPIITYPEFLVQPAKPPPLVSISGVLYTVYGAVALGTGLYAASEYLLKPMMANLASARHELAQTTLEKLAGFNEKLEQNVSVIPPHALSSSSLSAATRSKGNKGDSKDDDEEEKEEEEDEDVESLTSDPTELWHRDVATQTTESASGSAQESQKDEGNSEQKGPDPLATVTSQQQRIKHITARLSEYQDADTESTSLENGTRNRIVELHTYLDGLAYSAGSFTSSRAFSSFANGVEGVGVPKNEEDAIANFRSEIRGFKGALLSARNFPAGGYARKGLGTR